MNNTVLIEGENKNLIFSKVEELINNKENMFILDSKNEYLNYFNDKLNGYNKVIINFKDFIKSNGWNPLELPYKYYKENRMDLTTKYLSIIGSRIYSDINLSDFWNTASINLFTACALGLFEDGKTDEINLDSIYYMLDSASKSFSTSDYLSEYIISKGKDSSIYKYGSITALAPRDTKGGILATAKDAMLTFVGNNVLSSLLNNTTFTIDKPTVIFVISDNTKLSRNLSTLFVEEYYNIDNLHLILDNFDLLDKSNELPNILLKGNTYISTHSIKNFEDIYGTNNLNLCNVIENNTSKEVTIPKVNIDYPELEIKDIKIFDMESYITNLYRKLYKEDSIKNKNINDMLDDLDKKFKELDEKDNKK